MDIIPIERQDVTTTIKQKQKKSEIFIKMNRWMKWTKLLKSSFLRYEDASFPRESKSLKKFLKSLKIKFFLYSYKKNF